MQYTKMTLACGIIALILAICPGFFAYTMLTSPRNINNTNNALFMIGLNVAFLLAALYCLLYPLIYRSWHVYVYSEGFAFSRDGKINAFRWDQIDCMWQRITKRYMNGIYIGTQ